MKTLVGVGWSPGAVAIEPRVVASGKPGVAFAAPPRPPAGAAAVVKRGSDLVLGAALTFCLLPVAMVVAFAVRLETPGPVLVRQVRLGRGGRRFVLLKFRSMVDGAALRRADVEHLNEASGPIFKVRRDPRVTRVGRVIRRAGLDELPQLLNVLHGEMSLVGPRPPLPAEVERDPVRQQRRLCVQPGITGLWQVGRGDDLSYEAMMRLDATYLRRWSPALDALILLRTLPAMVRGKGAC